MFSLAVLVLAVAWIPRSDSAKILAYPMFGGSQYIGMKRIAQELASRGHAVTLLVSTIPDIKPIKDVEHAIYKVPYGKDMRENVFKRVISGGMLKELSSPTGVNSLMRGFCESTLNAKELLEPFKSYDIMVSDCTMACGPIVAEYLNLTRVDYCPVPPRVPVSSLYHAPTFLSYVPQVMSRNPGQMNFLQRVKNTLVYGASFVMVRAFMLGGYNDIKIKYNINPGKSYFEALGDAEMVLFLADFVLDYPYPILPGHKLIGPINIQPPHPLTPEFQDIVDSSGEYGVIIVSFGSNVASVMEKKEVDMMAEAFGRLKETVIWRLKGYIPANLASNVKPVAWLPQNDLLAHDKMRAFVSHVGQNSYYESVYRGVPLIAVPLAGDQPDNAAAVEDKGVGLSFDIHTVTADELYSAIRRVVDEPSFRTAARRFSGLMQDRRRTPVQEAGDWVEYTLRHGRLTHLRPASAHLTWYQYFLLDVMLFLVMVLVLVAIVIKLLWKCCYRICCKGSQKVKTQ